MQLSRIRLGDHKETMLDPARGQGLGIAAIALGFVTLFALWHPNPLVLAVLSGLLVAAGFVLAGVVALRHRHDPGSIGDRMLLPALIVFFGFAASIFCDADAAAQALGLLN